MFSYSQDYDKFDYFGEYEYNLAQRSVYVVPEIGDNTLLTEAPAELTNDDLVAQVQACHYFEADASPAPITPLRVKK